MISSKDIEDYSYLVSARFEAINSHYLKLMGQQINEIGRLSPSNLHRLQQMARYNQNISEINQLLAQETNRTLEELYQVYDMSGFSLYDDYADTYKANGKTQVPFADNMAIQGYLNSVKSLTQGTFMNMSNTTIVSHQNYKQLIDTAIDAVATGQTDYNSIIREQMMAIADEGLTVTYASGYKRRLDSAVRMNILEGVRKVSDGVRKVAGEEFGADGVEISVHALCANDHIDIQGKQYSNTEFEQVNNNLKRKLGTCNCKHIIYPIILGISTPAYTDKELKQYKDNSQKQVTLTMGYNADGTPKIKTMTKYEATQVQRNIETEIRKAKDRHIIAESAGDSVVTKQAKDKILALRKTYKRISEEAGLTPKWDRTFVAGYAGKQTTPKPITLKSQVTIAKQDNISIQQSNDIVNKAIFERYNHRINDLNVNFVKYDNIDKFITETKLGADFTGMDERLASATANQLANLSNQYETMLTKVSVGELDITSAPAGTEVAMNVTQATLTFNKSVVKDYNKFIERMSNAVEKGQFPNIPKTQFENYVATHEFAHTLLDTESSLKNYVNAPTKNIQKARKEIKELRQNYEEHLRELNAEWKELELKSLETFDIDVWDRAVKVKDKIDSITISKYASMNADEFMAEAFVDAMLSDNPSEYSLKVKSIIDKYFKK